PPPRSTLFPYTTLFRSVIGDHAYYGVSVVVQADNKIILAGEIDYDTFGLERFNPDGTPDITFGTGGTVKSALGSAESTAASVARSEEHTSELQSRGHLV